MRLVALTVVASLADIGLARADQWVAIRPGVMCTSTDALARLTLPNGDSRTHLASPRPDDLGTAAAGGCIDIPPGARVTVQQSFRNTSRVIYAGQGAPTDGVMTVPNIDFQSIGGTGVATAAPTSPAAVPPGLAPFMRVSAGAGLTVTVLMDRRITPAIREAMEGSGGDPDTSFEPNSALYADFTRHPPLNASFVLQTTGGLVIERKQLDRPLASVELAPFHGLPHPALFLTVNYSAGMGGWNGPATDLVVPAETGLAPVRVAAVGGRTEPFSIYRTLHAGWFVAPSRFGGPEELMFVFCKSGPGPDGRQGYDTFRFVGGHWTVATRLAGACDEIENLPPRSEFP